MEQWIRDLIARSVGGVKALADAAFERIAWLYNVILTVGLSVRAKWDWLVQAGRYWRDRLGNVARQYYLTLWHIIFVRIPAVISNVKRELIEWASNVIVRLRNELINGLNELQRWIVREINRFLDFIGRLADWARREVAKIWDTLARVVELVFTLLTSPARMAKWLLAALLTEALTYVDEHAEEILDWFQRKSIHYAGRVAGRIELMLSRLL